MNHLSHAAAAALLAAGALLPAPPCQAQAPRRRASAGDPRPARVCTNWVRRHGSLAARIACQLDSPPFDRALWGVVIADPRGRIVFDRNGERLFVPASTAKLVVTAVAAALLPPDFRFRTSVYATAPVVRGTVAGDLVLYGRGDPMLSARYFPSRFAAFDELADSLRKRGVTRIAGNVVGDASYFDSVVVHRSWQAYDLNWWYAAPVTALAFNDNCVDFVIEPGPVGQPPVIALEPDLGVVRFTNRAVTVLPDEAETLDFDREPGTNDVWAAGDLPSDASPDTEHFAVRDAPAWAAAAFRSSLERHGIRVDGTTRETFDSAAFALARARGPLAEHVSPPLEEVLRPILEQSQNWFAEMLLKTLGRQFGGAGAGTWRAGLEVERRFLIDSLGVDSTLFSLADGSGLSTWNLIAPRAMAQLLLRMREHPRAGPFLDALPVGGETGTLSGRFHGTRMEGWVHAKTGSIFRANTLAGYYELPDGRAWTFVIDLNNHTFPTRQALSRIDAIVAELAR